MSVAAQPMATRPAADPGSGAAADPATPAEIRRLTQPPPGAPRAARAVRRVALWLDRAPPVVAWEFHGQPALDDLATLQAAARSLRVNGLVVFRRFYEAQTVERLRIDCHHLHKRLRGLGGSGDAHALGPGVLLRTPRTRRAQARTGQGLQYGDLVRSGETIVNFRAEDDAGMIDIFRPEIFFQGHDAILQCPVKDRLVQRLAEIGYGRSPGPAVSNLYINQGLTRTRGFHVDGWGFKLKSFVYLTEVHQSTKGPYCYARGTHDRRWLAAANQLYNRLLKRKRTEFEIFDPRRGLVLTGHRGDLIVSQQSGAHRGHPQGPQGRRYVLVQMYDEFRGGSQSTLEDLMA